MASTKSMNRRHLLRLGAVAASAVGVEKLFNHGGVVDAAAGGFDQSFLLKKADVKQIWDFATIEQIQLGIGPMKNAMNAFQTSYLKSFYLIIDIRGAAVIFGLDDAMWAKYGFGTLYGVHDATTGAPAKSNPLYARQTSIADITQDDHLQALQQRGAHIAVCSDAIQGQARLIAQANHLSQDDVLQQFKAHLVPGATLTPSGSSLIAVAQQAGFTYAKE